MEEHLLIEGCPDIAGHTHGSHYVKSSSGLGLEVAIAMGNPAFFRERRRGSVPGQAKILEYKACRSLGWH